MRHIRGRAVITALLLFAAQAAGAAPGDAEPPWSRLRFTHEGLALEADLEIRRETGAAASLPATAPSPPGALHPSTLQLGTLTMDSAFRLSRFFERRRHAVLWFDPVNHAALLGTRETTGIGAGYRVSRYATHGVQVEKAAPASGERKSAAASTWPLTERGFTAYGAAADACTAVTEATALLLMDPERLGERASGRGVCVISRKQLLQPEVSAPEERALSAGYRLHSVDGAVSEVSTSRVIRYTVRLVPLAGGEGDVEDGHFLGFEGEIALEMDPETGIPVRLHGRAPLLGKVDFRLREAWRARNTPPAGVPSR